MQNEFVQFFNQLKGVPINESHIESLVKTIGGYMGIDNIDTNPVLTKFKDDLKEKMNIKFISSETITDLTTLLQKLHEADIRLRDARPDIKESLKTLLPEFTKLQVLILLENFVKPNVDCDDQIILLTDIVNKKISAVNKILLGRLEKGKPDRPPVPTAPLPAQLPASTVLPALHAQLPTPPTPSKPIAPPKPIAPTASPELTEVPAISESSDVPSASSIVSSAPSIPKPHMVVQPTPFHSNVSEFVNQSGDENDLRNRNTKKSKEDLMKSDGEVKKKPSSRKKFHSLGNLADFHEVLTKSVSGRNIEQQSVPTPLPLLKDESLKIPSSATKLPPQTWVGKVGQEENPALPKATNLAELNRFSDQANIPTSMYDPLIALNPKGHGNATHKYMKYKAKYLKLKQLLSS